MSAERSQDQHHDDCSSDEEKLQNAQGSDAQQLAQGTHKDQQPVLPSENLSDLLGKDKEGEESPSTPQNRTDVRVKDMSMATTRPPSRLPFFARREFTDQDVAAVESEAYRQELAEVREALDLSRKETEDVREQMSCMRKEMAQMRARVRTTEGSADRMEQYNRRDRRMMEDTIEHLQDRVQDLQQALEEERKAQDSWVPPDVVLKASRLLEPIASTPTPDTVVKQTVPKTVPGPQRVPLTPITEMDTPVSSLARPSRGRLVLSHDGPPADSCATTVRYEAAHADYAYAPETVKETMPMTHVSRRDETTPKSAMTREPAPVPRDRQFSADAMTFMEEMGALLSRSSHTGDIDKPIHFHGRPNETWSTWRAVFERYLRFRHMDAHSHAAAVLLAGRLDGEALEAYNNLPRAIQDSCWDSLTALEGVFGGKKEQLRGREQLAAMRLEPDDTADAFLHRFTIAYRRAHPNICFDIDTPNSTWVDDFVSTIRRHKVISHVAYFTPNTVRDAARALEGWITSQRKQLDTLKFAREAARCTDSLDLDPMYHAMIPQQAVTAAAQVTNTPPKHQQKQNSKESPKPGPPAANTAPPGRRDLTDEQRARALARIEGWRKTYNCKFYPQSGVCWICGGADHPLVKCPQKEANRLQPDTVPETQTTPASGTSATPPSVAALNDKPPQF